ncbi:hypothetical protein [Leifsonia sp. AG29]|uniref:hypothetical protein n=1 Tax=Leifsonia sp. AG29 TaxID=2598860 RepID=UPI00131B8051|nr:hypothetical protein [Leifsonia sp. AG29]
MTAELTRPEDVGPGTETRGRRGRSIADAAAPGGDVGVPPAAGAPPKGKNKSAPRAGTTLPVEPRVDLLPPEVKAARRNDAIARRLLLALVIVIAIVAASIGGSTVLAIQANATLATTQAEAVSLTRQQQKYAKVRGVQSQIALTQAGQQVGAATEIDWEAFLDKVRATAGAGVAITGITLDSASPLAAYQQPSVPLEGARVATVTIDAKTPSLDNVSAWLAQLATLPAVADVAPGAVTLDTTGYTASAILHLDQSAFDGRFAQKGK